MELFSPVDLLPFLFLGLSRVRGPCPQSTMNCHICGCFSGLTGFIFFPLCDVDILHTIGLLYSLHCISTPDNVDSMPDNVGGTTFNVVFSTYVLA